MSKRMLVIIAVFMLFSGISSAKEPLTFVFTNYAPANYQTETGEFGGFFIDIIKEALEQRMGIPVTMSVFPWKRCQLLVEEGQADMIATVPTPERLVYAVATETPIWVKKWRLFTYAGHPDLAKFDAIKSIEDLKKGGYTVVSYIGNSWSDTMIKGAGIPVSDSNTVEAMYKMLAAKRGDVFIEDTLLVVPALKGLELTDKIVATEGIVAEGNFNLLIGKKSQYSDMISQLDTVLKEMWQDGTIEEILARYTQQ